MDNTGFVAKRYLFSKKHISLISTLTIISITGVTIGTALLIVVLSIFNGFFDVIQNLLLSSDPDLRVVSSEQRYFDLDDNLLEDIRSVPEIRVVSPYVKGKALLVFQDNRNEVVEVKGVQKESFFQINEISNSVTSGVFDVSVRNRKPGVFMHQDIADRYRIGTGDEIALLSAAGMRRALTQITVPRIYRYDVRGTFFVQQITQGPSVYIDLRAAQRLFNTRNNISGIDFKLTDTQQAEQAKAKLQQALGPGFEISTWYDLQKPLYDVMYLEKWGAYLILMIIVAVAVLNILGSLTMIVIQKRRDIGILMSMGHTPADIKSIFRKQGFYIGLIGCGIGGAIGLFLSWLQKEFGILKLSSAFIIDAYPAQISPLDVSLVLTGSLLLCVLASWYPANRAARVQPADAVRFE